MKSQIILLIVMAMAALSFAQLLPSQKSEQPVNLNMPLNINADLDSVATTDEPEKKVRTQKDSLAYTETERAPSENSSKKNAIYSGFCASGILLSTILGGNNFINCRIP